jgi:hypothetical protein
MLLSAPPGTPRAPTTGVTAPGGWPSRTCEPLTDDIASAAYWYQAEPHILPAFAPSPGRRLRPAAEV